MTQIEQIVGPYEDRQAVCHDYDRRTAEVAQRVAASIRSHLPGVLVEHIGSTCVLGCAGKGIVDLMLVYPEGQLAAARDVLDALGFQRQTTRDPFPEDRPMRHGFRWFTTAQPSCFTSTSSPPPRLKQENFAVLEIGCGPTPTSLPPTSLPRKPSLPAASRTPWTYCIRKGEFVERALRGGGARSPDNRNKPKSISG